MYNYDRTLVAAAYKAENPDKSHVSEKALLDYDTALFNRLHTELMRQAPAAELPTDRFSISMLMFYAVCSQGRSARLRVEAACRYFESVRPQAPIEMFRLASFAPVAQPETNGEAA